jgi:hypothetical protein
MNLHQKYYHFQKGFQMVADAAKGISNRVPNARHRSSKPPD